MHVYCVTRGIKNAVDNFFTLLQGVFLPWPFRPPGAKEIIPTTKVQVQVRPIQLWEIVYPAEFHDVMCTTLFSDGGGKPNHSWQDKFVFMIRKMLKLEPVGDYKKDLWLPCRGAQKDFECVAIGMKPDKWVDMNDVKCDEKVEGSFEAL